MPESDKDRFIPSTPYVGDNLSYYDADKCIQKAYWAAKNTPMGGPVNLTAEERYYNQRAKEWKRRKGIE